MSRAQTSWRDWRSQAGEKVRMVVWLRLRQLWAQTGARSTLRTIRTADRSGIDMGSGGRARVKVEPFFGEVRYKKRGS